MPPKPTEKCAFCGTVLVQGRGAKHFNTCAAFQQIEQQRTETRANQRKQNEAVVDTEPRRKPPAPPVQSSPSLQPSEYHTSTPPVNNDPYHTDYDAFGIKRVYPYGPPTYILGKTLPVPRDNPNDPPPHYPFSNPTSALLLDWQYTGSCLKSNGELRRLAQLAKNPDFDLEDFANYKPEREQRKLDTHIANQFTSPNKGWHYGSVSIPVPCEKTRKPEHKAPVYTVNKILYRKPLDVMKAAFRERKAQDFHLTPYKMYWKPSGDAPEERLYGDIFTADAFHEEYQNVQQKTGDGEEAVVGDIILYSDETQLAHFGGASAWPIYLFIGNEPKELRMKATRMGANHIAYIPKFDVNDFQEFYEKEFEQPASRDVISFVWRELVHAIWNLLLDDEVVDAYSNGYCMEFLDEVIRRFFPRFIIYSSDYPEKMRLACLKHNGECLCPRCLAKKDSVHLVGTQVDLAHRNSKIRTDSFDRQKKVEQARQLIFAKGAPIGGQRVEQKLKSGSLLPHRSPFSTKLGEDLDYFQLFAPDLLHEIELGVWKHTFDQLVHILYCEAQNGVQELNKRYKVILPFGKSTIRKFRKGVAGTGVCQIPAWDYEDMLQCSIPCFEGLFGSQSDNNLVSNLLFELCTWHALAKLRIHSDTTRAELSTSSIRLGRLFRRFQQQMCSKYGLRALPSEITARRTNPVQNTEKKKKFNMNTYKFHALPDYATSIQWHGTTDNTSTQAGELEHKRLKWFYNTSNKSRAEEGIFNQVLRERFLFGMREERRLANQQDEDRNKSTLIESTYHIASDDLHNHMEIQDFVSKHKYDPAIKDFLPRLHHYLVLRLKGKDDPGANIHARPQDILSVAIQKNTLYFHKTMRIEYTTYDLQRGEDIINPDSRPDVMVLANDSAKTVHPYWYARILAIFHVVVVSRGGKSVSLDVLFVRWMGRSAGSNTAWGTKCLYRVAWQDTEDTDAYGFLNPVYVLRAVHILPDFAEGVDDEVEKTWTLSQPLGQEKKLYLAYYIGMFVDRDMVMRYRGGGVGHVSTRDETDIFCADRDKLDQGSGISDDSDSEADEEDSIQAEESGSSESGSELDSDTTGESSSDVDESEQEEDETPENSEMEDAYDEHSDGAEDDTPSDAEDDEDIKTLSQLDRLLGYAYP